MMSPLTVPCTTATATSIFASTLPLAPTINVPLVELMRPDRWPSTRIMALKLASPVTTVPLPTKPLRLPSLISRASDSLSVIALGDDDDVYSGWGFTSAGGGGG